MKRVIVSVAAFLCVSCTGWAQFGGGPGDLVLYSITYNGSGDLQTQPSGTTNSAAQNAAVKVTHLADVPFQATEGFGLKRQVLYTSPAETFQIGLDEENSVGLHRLPLYDLRLLQLEGLLNTVGNVIGGSNTFITLFKGLDVGGDVSLTDVKLAFWFPGPSPFIQPTSTQGPFPCPAGTSGFLCLLFVPGGIDILSLEPWIGLANVYPGGHWQPGVDQKMLLQQAGGVTIRQIRIRQGKQSPVIRTAGHTHLFTLQGAGALTLAGGGTLPMSQYDYTLIPENTAFTIANPVPYNGPLGRAGF
jgi:hypothetical protein